MSGPVVLAIVSTVRYRERMNLPTIKLPTGALPSFDLDVPSAEQLTSLARDAAHVGVGLAVLTVERVQALQTQIVELVTTSATNIVERVRDAV